MKTRANSFRTAAELIIIGMLLVAALNYQALLDQYALIRYHPSQAMASVEGRLDLTSQAKGVFARAKAQIDSKTAFNTDCDPAQGELELGCYYHGRMYTLQIDNDSLAPEMDVVSAHELLHAEWARMSASDRTKLGAELERVYNALNDSDLKARMAGYAKSEPGQEDNELHSILGTEFANLSPTLEQHYSEYFLNRAQIVAAHAQYQNVFNSRHDELTNELATIRQLKANLTVLNSRMSSYQAAGQIEQYNALVPQQNQLVDTINSRIDTYRSGVDEYNALSQTLDSQQITDTESTVSQ